MTSMDIFIVFVNMSDIILYIQYKRKENLNRVYLTKENNESHTL